MRHRRGEEAAESLSLPVSAWLGLCANTTGRIWDLGIAVTEQEVPVDALCLLQALECLQAKAPAHPNKDLGSFIPCRSPCQTAAPHRQDLFMSHFVFIYSHYMLNANNWDLEDRLCCFLFPARISMFPLRHYLN